MARRIRSCGSLSGAVRRPWRVAALVCMGAACAAGLGDSQVDWRPVADQAIWWVGATGFGLAADTKINPAWDTATGFYLPGGQYAVTVGSRAAGRRTVSLHAPLIDPLSFDRGADISVVGWMSGTDWWLDLAVLRLAGDPVDTTVLLDPDYSPAAGEEVLVVGHTADGGARRVVLHGAVRAVDVGGALARGYSYVDEGMIELDIPLLPGLQGAPVVNANGDVFAVVCGCTPGDAGIIRARLMSVLWPSIERVLMGPLEVEGAVATRDWVPNASRILRPYLGVSLRLGPEGEQPCLVAGLGVDSPAELANLAVGDVIESIEGAALREVGMRAALESHMPGETVEVAIRRGDERLVGEVTLGELVLPGIDDPDSRRKWEPDPEQVWDSTGFSILR